ncbi:MAG: hypothetical protein KDA85_21360 [Planctomycetaceae bacterium]|nr:hypothetical protein [Planctomycetaceae bacterium]
MAHTFLSLAYLDPGAGSLVLQAIVGGSAGAIVFLRHLWRTFRIHRADRLKVTSDPGAGI